MPILDREERTQGASIRPGRDFANSRKKEAKAVGKGRSKIHQTAKENGIALFGLICNNPPPEHVIALRAERYDNGLDIFTGEPLDEISEADWVAIQDGRAEPSAKLYAGEAEID